MALVLFVLFVLVPLAELAVVVAAADSFGLGVTLVALLAFSVAGAWLMKREGVAVWRRANRELAAGRPPASELLDGAMILAGGALLLTPGFITDFVGLMLLLPPVRGLIRPLALRAMARRATSVVAAAAASRPGPRGPAGGASSGFRAVFVDADPFVTDPFDGTDLFDGDDVDTGHARPEPTAKVIRVEPRSDAESDSESSRAIRPGD